MEVIDYYYKLLNLKYDATEKDVYESYHNKIRKYMNLPFLNEVQKTEVKELKKAKFVLSNFELRKTYDAIISQEMEGKKKVDDMKSNYREDKIDSQMMGNRVFSMIGIMTPPQKNYDIDRSFATIK